MSSIADALLEVRTRIERAARAVKREPGAVRLVAVSKLKPASAIREAYAAGQRDFGENYAQELAEKAAELADLADLRWHFIGHLQSNKAKVVAPLASLMHTIDTPSLAHEVARQAAKHGRPRLAVLAEVNIGGEAQKHGVTADALPALLEAIDREPALELRGLMTIPPQGDEATARAFDDLVALRERCGGAARLPELSMGMSDDLELAVARGATLVRIGTAIFGAR